MARETILIVDDSPAVRSLAERYLRDGGYQVIMAGDADEGLTLVRESRPDLILVDQVMPNMDGIALAREMKKISSLAETPIVLMGSSLESVSEDLALHGIVDSVSKPFDPHALLAVVENALIRSREPAPPRPAKVLSEQVSDPAEARRQRYAEVAEQIASRMVDALTSRLENLKDRAEEIERALVESLNPKALGALAEALRHIDPTGGIAAFGGDLDAVPLAEVMQMLSLQRQTGELEVVNDETEVSIFFREGAIDLAQAHGSPKEFLLGRYLIEDGTMTRQDLDLLLRNRTGGKLLGDQLVKLGYLSEEELRGALARQSSELLYEVLRWRTGRYLFRPQATRLEAQRARLGLRVSAILLEGFRRVDEWRVIEQVINNFDEILERNEEEIERLPEGSLTTDEEALLEEVDSRYTIREVVERGKMGSFKTCRILYQLISLKIVRKLPPPEAAPPMPTPGP